MAWKSPVVRLWLAVGVLLLLLAVPLFGPMRTAWHCYRLHLNGARAEAELLHKLEDGKLVLLLASGPQAGEGCTAGTAPAIHEEAEIGQRFEVVYFPDRPGECVLDSTIRNSGILLWSLTGGLASVVLLVLGVGAWIHRSFSSPGQPQRRMLVARAACPGCGADMAEGYLPLLTGVHWRELGQPVGLPHALGGLPGTVGWRGRPRLHAFRCPSCEIVTFQYGAARAE